MRFDKVIAKIERVQILPHSVQTKLQTSLESYIHRRLKQHLAATARGNTLLDVVSTKRQFKSHKLLLSKYRIVPVGRDVSSRPIPCRCAVCIIPFSWFNVINYIWRLTFAAPVNNNVEPRTKTNKHQTV